MSKNEETKIENCEFRYTPVYCKNCKYYSELLHSTESFIIGEVCNAKMNIENVFNYKEMDIIFKFKPDKLNRDNNCEFYKKSWYKFWIK